MELQDILAKTSNKVTEDFYVASTLDFNIALEVYIRKWCTHSDFIALHITT